MLQIPPPCPLPHLLPLRRLKPHRPRPMSSCVVFCRKLSSFFTCFDVFDSPFFSCLLSQVPGTRPMNKPSIRFQHSRSFFSSFYYCTDVLEEVLRQRSEAPVPSTTHVISNRMEFDEVRRLHFCSTFFRSCVYLFGD